MQIYHSLLVRMIAVLSCLAWTEQGIFHRTRCVTWPPDVISDSHDAVLADNKWAPFPTYPVVLGFKGTVTYGMCRTRG